MSNCLEALIAPLRHSPQFTEIVGDRGVKFEDYAGHSMGEYWIVDIEARVVEQYLPRDGSWHLEHKSSSGEIRSRVIAGFVAPVPAFFDAGANFSALQALMD